MHAWIADLFPLNRSITGAGLRATLGRIAESIPLQIHEVPTGTPALDWIVPPEWTVRDAYIRTPNGAKIADFAQNNLHLVGYSEPVRTTLSKADLLPHLHGLPEHPNWIPYRTAYYHRSWGFCLPQAEIDRLPEGMYEVVVDSELKDGSLTYGECLLPGRTREEVLISVHVCHPSLANDNLSGAAVAVWLARALAAQANRYSYRFLFIPATIGSLVWLARNRDRLGNIRHGLVLAGLGDAGAFTFKRSRREGAEINQAVEMTLQEARVPHRVRDFSPYGYDERQYCSPGFNLPVACLMRSAYGEYPEYHTSADNLDFVRPEHLAESLAVCRAIIARLDAEERLMNLQPLGEPQLGRRVLYDAHGGASHRKEYQLALLWILNYSDGRHSLQNIARRSGLSLEILREASGRLREAHLVEDV